MEYIVGAVVAMAFGLLAVFGERIQRRVTDRRLRRHTCHTRCSESRWCACGCRDGMYGDATGTRCVVCGTQYVTDDEEFRGPYSSGHVNVRPTEITHEMPAPKGFTSWGWERDREFRKARHEGQDHE